MADTKTAVFFTPLFIPATNTDPMLLPVPGVESSMMASGRYLFPFPAVGLGFARKASRDDSVRSSRSEKDVNVSPPPKGSISRELNVQVAKA